MELKYGLTLEGVVRNDVLIVPLWNWNRVVDHAETDVEFGSNRTFMELKLINMALKASKIQVLIVPLWNWNMSLIEEFSCKMKVLIVPLWNWNLYANSSAYKANHVLIVPLWNWNWAMWSQTSLELGSSNRTFMELKCVLTNTSINNVLRF